MSMLSKPMQELFVQSLLKGNTEQKAAIIAGYSSSNAAQQASRLLRKPHIIARIQELNQLAQDEMIMNLIERKKRLTEIAKDTKTQTAVKAISELNKMERIYDESANINNYTINVVYEGNEEESALP